MECHKAVARALAYRLKPPAFVDRVLRAAEAAWIAAGFPADAATLAGIAAAAKGA